MFGPLDFSRLYTLERLDVAIEKEVGELLLTVGALFEFGLCDGGRLTEIAITIEDFVDLVLYFSLKVQFFK